MGVTLRQEARQLEYSQPGVPPIFERIVYIDGKDADFSHGILGQHIPVVGLSLKRTAIILASAPRPLTLVLQIGIRNVPDGVSLPNPVSLNTIVKDVNEEVSLDGEN